MGGYGGGLKIFEKSENIRVGAFLWGYTSGVVAGYGGSVRWRGTWGGTYSEISHLSSFFGFFTF